MIEELPRVARRARLLRRSSPDRPARSSARWPPSTSSSATTRSCRRRSRTRRGAYGRPRPDQRPASRRDRRRKDHRSSAGRRHPAADGDARRASLAEAGYPNSAVEDILSYALFPEVALKFFAINRERAAPDVFPRERKGARLCRAPFFSFVGAGTLRSGGTAPGQGTKTRTQSRSSRRADERPCSACARRAIKPSAAPQNEYRGSDATLRF